MLKERKKGARSVKSLVPSLSFSGIEQVYETFISAWLAIHKAYQRSDGSFLVRRALINLSVNETGGHISRVSYRTSFAASRKLSRRQIDEIKIQVRAFCNVFARNCANDVLGENRYTAAKSTMFSLPTQCDIHPDISRAKSRSSQVQYLFSKCSETRKTIQL